MSVGCLPSLLVSSALVPGEDQPLTKEMMLASSATIGRNPDGHLIYAQWNLSSLGLTSIELLRSYRYLQRLSLDDNRIESLGPLQELHDLVFLSAINNKLRDDVFDSLAASGMTLERLNLSGNHLTNLRGLRQLPFLMEFTAVGNNITDIHDDDVECLHSLTRLNLTGNKIRKVALNTFAKCGKVRSLNLSHNLLTDVKFLVHLSANLDTLNLEHNNIERLLGLGAMHELVWLYLRHNAICSWDEVEILSGLENLRVLSLDDNPLLQVVEVSSTTTIPKGEVRSKVAQDIDFAATRVSTQPCSNLGTCSKNVQLMAITTPPAIGHVHHLPPAPQGVGEWLEDGKAELVELSPMEQHRAHIISILPRLSMLNSEQVKPEEIPRAARILKKKCVGFRAAGSAARAVESKRANASMSTL